MKRLSLLLLLASCSVVAGTTLYKSVDEQGNVTYSDSPPPGASDVNEMEVPDNSTNVLPGSDLQKQIEEQQRADKQAADRQRAAQQDWQARYAQAKADLEQAEKTLNSAQEIKEGDTVGSAFGGARPNQEWIDNLEQAENDVAAKQAALDQIKRERPR